MILILISIFINSVNSKEEKNEQGISIDESDNKLITSYNDINIDIYKAFKHRDLLIDLPIWLPNADKMLIIFRSTPKQDESVP